MREIKFRAWDKENEVMREHFTIESIDGEPFDNHGYAYPEWKLMQYTGLKDKNGKEIYEGDICKHLTGFFGDIKYAVSAFCYGDDNEGYEEVGLYNDVIEVIGNIYENPELLDVK